MPAGAPLRAGSWGWDWAKRFSPQGIWRPVYLAYIPTATAVITSLGAIVRPAAGEPARALRFVVDVRLSVYATAAVRATVEVGLSPGTPLVAQSVCTCVPRLETADTSAYPGRLNGVRVCWLRPRRLMWN